MKKLPFNQFLLSSTLLLTLVSISHVSAAQVVAGPPLQSGVILTATGQMCASSSTSPICLNFIFDFDPIGGPVIGSYGGTVSWNDQGVSYTGIAQGTLTGAFVGGDGGEIEGTLAGQSTTIGGGDQSTRDITGAWSGHLYSNGTGNGSSEADGAGYWSVTFDRQAFQSALNSTIPTPQVPQITATSISVVGQDVQLDPIIRSFIAATLPLNQATVAILNQDSVIIARDANNNFYAINNQGKAISLPPALSSVFQLNDQFGILGNENLLASSEHSSVRGTINGGGDFVYLNKIPTDLMDRDYMMLAMSCSTGSGIGSRSRSPVAMAGPIRDISYPNYQDAHEQCRPQLKVNSPASSMHLIGNGLIGGENQQAGSTEHDSVRGTINGGGDFIYNPPSQFGHGLASLSLVRGVVLQNGGNQAYLGVQVLNVTDRADVQMVQQGSPAEKAGLAVNDQIISVSGVFVDDSQNTLATLVSQYSGGDQVELGVIRLGESNVTPVNVTLATLLPPVVVTPSAEITVNNKTEFVVDIGFNGVTGVLVLADIAHVREPVTGSEVDVPAGSVVIVVPGYKVGSPIKVNDSDIIAWWNGEQRPTPALSPTPTPTPVCGTTWLLIGLVSCFCIRRKAVGKS